MNNGNKYFPNIQFDIVLINPSGIPVFNYSYKNKPLPLAVVGTLFGIYSYCSSNNSEIQNAKGAMSQTLWKQLKDNIIVIAVNGYSGNLNPYLDLIYNALLFYVGSDALESMRSQELLRKNLKQTVLEFATEIQSFYVCLFASYRIAAATDDWWSLSGQEIALIVGYMRTEKRAEVKDVPVYLHIKSPQMAVRLMWCRLSLNCVLVALCGLNPTLDVFISTSKNLFKKCISSLKNAESTYPFNVPPHIILDTIVLGYLVMDRESNRAVSSFCPHRQPVKFPFPVKVVLAPFVRMKLLRDAVRYLKEIPETENHESFRRCCDHLSYYIKTAKNIGVCQFPAETSVTLARKTANSVIKTLDELLNRT
ncbi:hypothetical protein QYM36_002305 [Artemia franciscana]|uniref:Uncharacterized protein n=1 Tax=Artemia franciscana TaxID=6661 RepID=A0AA88LA24_ARTSF|nr:hypothetical protein QYM36_002305 [Artemia franciscana]